MPNYVLTIDGQAQDLAARRIVLERLTVSWRTGRQFVFRQAVRHDLADFHLEQSVLFEVDGTVYFRGAIKAVAHLGEPGREAVEYTADGLRALSRQVTATTAAGVPKLVWNAEPDDEDYDPARTGRTVGQMIQEVLDGHAAALQALGVIEGAGYLQAELDQLTAVPGRVVLRERDLDRAVSELLAHQPEYVFLIHPGERRYRFHRISDLPTTTVTIGGEDRVLSNLLVPDLRTRYTAVRIVGDEEAIPAVARVSDGSLTPEWDPAKEADWTLEKALAPADTDEGSVTGYTSTTITDAAKSWAVDRWQGGRVVAKNEQAGMAQTLTVLSNTATTLTLQGSLVIEPTTYTLENGPSAHRCVYSRWRITEAARRRIAPIIPGGLYAPVGWSVFQQTYKPVVCEARDFGGGTGWFYRDAGFDWDEGRFVTAQPLARGRLDEPGAAVGPDDVLLIYAWRGANLVARYPAEGFAGSAYTEFGLARERVIHDEQFVTAADQARYEALAEAMHRALADVAYAGRVRVSRLDWSLGHLGKRLNLTGLDRLGNPVTTGWEAIGALLLGATFHLREGVTELDLTTDTSDWSLPYAELRERRRTADRLRELEAQVRHLRRRTRQSPGASPPDPDALHRGLEGVESLAVAGGEKRVGHLTVQSDDATVLIVNPFGSATAVFDFAVNTDLVAERGWVEANFAPAGDIPAPSTETPADVADAGAAGAADDYARGDHAHRGVTSLSDGAVVSYGAVVLTEGDGTIVTNAAGTFTLAADFYDDNPAPVGDAPSPGSATQVNRRDHVHLGVRSLAKAGGAQRFGNVTVSEGANITITAAGNDLEIAAEDVATLSNDFPFAVDSAPFVGAGKTASRWDHVHVGVTGLYAYGTNPDDAYAGLVQFGIGDGPILITFGANNEVRWTLDRDSNAPQDVGATAVAGTTDPGFGNHVHRGVGSFAKTGGTARYGAISLTQGSNLTITDNGNGTFTLANDLSVSTATPQDVGSSGSAGTGNALSRGSHVHRGVTSFAKTGGTPRYGAIGLAQGSNVTITDDGDGTFTIAASGGGGGGLPGGNEDNDLLKWDDDTHTWDPWGSTGENLVVGDGLGGWTELSAQSLGRLIYGTEVGGWTQTGQPPGAASAWVIWDEDASEVTWRLISLPATPTEGAFLRGGTDVYEDFAACEDHALIYWDSVLDGWATLPPPAVRSRLVWDEGLVWEEL